MNPAVEDVVKMNLLEGTFCECAAEGFLFQRLGVWAHEAFDQIDKLCLLLRFGIKGGSRHRNPTCRGRSSEFTVVCFEPGLVFVSQECQQSSSKIFPSQKSFTVNFDLAIQLSRANFSALKM